MTTIVEMRDALRAALVAHHLAPHEGAKASTGSADEAGPWVLLDTDSGTFVGRQIVFRPSPTDVAGGFFTDRDRALECARSLSKRPERFVLVVIDKKRSNHAHRSR
jgi:hypothetical protein